MLNGTFIRMNPHALQVLEYTDALNVVARNATSDLGAQGIRELTPDIDPQRITAELLPVAEMMTLLAGDEGWGLPVIPDLGEPLRKLRVEGSVWEAPALHLAGVLIVSSRTVRRDLHTHRYRVPLLYSIAETLIDLPRVAEEIARAVSEDGQVRDEASPDLYRLRRQIRGARSKIVARLSEFAGSLPIHLQVTDASVTIREGRYVIPVRREGRGEVGGIVHDESGTGATLFIEPPVAIEMMNRLRELEAAEVREVLRILRELTVSLRPHREELLRSLQLLARLDTVYARARYAGRIGAHLPQILPAGSEDLNIVQGRHPLLLGGEGEVVPFDLRMERGERTLLISGPNTGGKTVLLKAVGLIAMLAQSGVIPPVGPGSRLPVFTDIFADIGDEQSIEASLSTFSAHLKNLGETLAGADHRSLVLIDEIGSGTDPVEGGALAQAILLELTRRSAFTMATTHLGQLKLLAVENERVINASLQFDSERLSPTYRLLKGVPGRSYGLAIARRLGLPEDVLKEAEAVLPQGERDVAKLLLELESKEQRISEVTASLEARLAETERLRAELTERQQDMERREQDAERRARQQARDLLLSSRQEVETAIQEVRAAADQNKLADTARAARRRVEEAARKQKEKTLEPQSQRPRPEGGSEQQQLLPGLRVRVASIGSTGTVVEVRDGKVTVETGGLRMTLAKEDLVVLPPGDQKLNRTVKRGGYISADIEASSEVDLRGLRVDELDLRLGRALDAALMSGLPTFRIIHGKGTGALRAEVQELLKADRRVRVIRPGDRFEGGTGVTVVEFA
ncbi:endonuclease MutS2 [soil metagenome]